MTSDNCQFDRRSVLKASGSTLTGLIGATGAAAANPDRGRGRGRKGNNGRGRGQKGNKRNGPPEWAQFKNGRLKMAAESSEWAAAAKAARDLEGIPDDAEVVPYDAMEQTVESFNKMIDSGEMELHAQGTEMEFKNINENLGDE